MKNFLRSAGVLMPVFSLPGKYGIGGFGAEAYDFVDFLADAKIRFWQVLPICETDYSASPYQSPSAFAGNPLFIDPELLFKSGLLTALPIEQEVKNIDYLQVNQERAKLLKEAFTLFKPCKEFEEFKKQEFFWLNEYCEYKATVLGKSKEYYAFIQYLFSVQWQKLKDYANSKGVYIIGDMPIYVSKESADYVSHPELFDTKNGVAGCPPDAYATNGQKWGNPLYNWDAHKKSGFKWWIERISRNLTLFDALRIDHFRGFESYFSIPKDGEPKDGVWLKAAGTDFIKTINAWFNSPPFIAEDLGLLTDEVRALLCFSGYPGMRVIQFGFEEGDGKSEHLPHNYPPNSVALTGTHDNDTVLGYYKKASKIERLNIDAYLGITSAASAPYAFIRAVLNSPSILAVFPFADCVGLDTDYRINTPGTVGTNWLLRFRKELFTKNLSSKLRKSVELSGRATL